MTDLTITVQQRDVYGNRTYYPVCERSKLFAEIAGTKTLTMRTLLLIGRLGYIVDKSFDMERTP